MEAKSAKNNAISAKRKYRKHQSFIALDVSARHQLLMNHTLQIQLSKRCVISTTSSARPHLISTWTIWSCRVEISHQIAISRNSSINSENQYRTWLQLVACYLRQILWLTVTCITSRTKLKDVPQKKFIPPDLDQTVGWSTSTLSINFKGKYTLKRRQRIRKQDFSENNLILT